jgi:hypothetical protein
VNAQQVSSINQLYLSFSFSVLLSFSFKIIGKIIKIVDHLINNALFSYINMLYQINWAPPIIILMGQSFSIGCWSKSYIGTHNIKL